MLTIGELATYAGVTVRAVRHYHAKGLLPEPDRDHSGYRRYDASAVVELIRIRTLAEAGVPLARVRELLRAGEEEFAAAVADIDRRLRAEIRERQLHRERIARLSSGDGLALPPEVVAYLDRLRELGVDERIVQAERDGWIPLAARSPERVREWMARKHEQLADPRLVAFYLTLSRALDRSESLDRTEDRAADRAADRTADRTADRAEPKSRADHRVGPPGRADEDSWLVELADELAAYITRMADEQGEHYVDDIDLEPPLVPLMDTLAFDTVPPARRLTELLRQRGWTGWTKLERLPPQPE